MVIVMFYVNMNLYLSKTSFILDKNVIKSKSYQIIFTKESAEVFSEKFTLITEQLLGKSPYSGNNFFSSNSIS